MSQVGACLGEVRLPNKSGDLVQVQVVRSFTDPRQLPVSTEGVDDAFPAVFVRFVGANQQKGDDGSEQRIGTLEIALRVFLAEHGDDEYTVSVMERIAFKLLTQRIIDGRYRAQLPLGWTVPDAESQSWPLWWATMTASYAMPTISEVANEIGESFEM
jgi:hypothetical protein